MDSAGITGVILAGGLGRRMGGADKGLQLLAGKSLVQWVAERFAPQVNSLLINANRNPDAYAALGYPVFADTIPNFAGPLAGLHAALAAARQPLVAMVPCDSPHLPRDLVARLRAQLEANRADVAIATDGHRPHPVFCLCRRSVLPRLESYLAGGGRKVMHWCATIGAVQVAFADQPDAFRNFNTPEDLES